MLRHRGRSSPDRSPIPGRLRSTQLAVLTALDAGLALVIARAAPSRPRLLLLEEPDDVLGADGHRLVRQLLDDVEATALVVTHDPRLAGMLDAGRLVACGAAGDVVV